jgi:hypothetical protein
MILIKTILNKMNCQMYLKNSMTTTIKIQMKYNFIV